MPNLETLIETLFCTDSLHTALLMMTDPEIDLVFVSAIEHRDLAAEYTNPMERQFYDDVIEAVIEIRTAGAVAVA